MPLDEKVLSAQTLATGSFLTMERLVVELPNGHVSTRDVVRHPGAVAVFAVDDDGRVLLVRQYRVALGRTMLEIPAGKIDAGEDPVTAAARELREETGCEAAALVPLISVVTAAGFCDEVVHVYRATGLTCGEPSADDDEFVEVEWLGLDVLLARIVAGEVDDSKTVAAALLYAHLTRTAG